jgi:hypothetical protein
VHNDGGSSRSSVMSKAQGGLVDDMPEGDMCESARKLCCYVCIVVVTHFIAPAIVRCAVLAFNYRMHRARAELEDKLACQTFRGLPMSMQYVQA